MADIIRRNDIPPAGRLQECSYREPALETSEKKIDLRQFYRMLLKRKWLILAVALTVVAATALQVYTTTPLYSAVARIQIDPEAANVLPYEDLYQSSLYFLATESYVRTQAKILESRSLALRVVKKLNLVDDPVFNAPRQAGFFAETLNKASLGFRNLLGQPQAGGEDLEALDSREEKLADAFGSGVGVNPMRGTRLMEISFTSHDPELAARIVNVMGDEYIEQNLEKRFNAATKATEFLDTQLLDLKKKVEQTQEDLVDYARANNIVDLNIDERENIIVQKLEALSQELTEVEAKLISEAAQYESLEGASVENFPQSLKTATIITLENRQFSLEQELAKMSTTFGPEWRPYKQLEQEISTVKSQLKAEKEQAIERTRLDYATAVRHQNKLKKALEEQRLKANQLFQDSIQYNILKREADTNKQLYEGLLQRLKQAGISAGLKSSNIHVVDRAQPPQFAVSPAKERFLFIGTFMGLMLGFGLAFLMEYVDNTLKTPEDVEQFVGLPTLAVIPRLDEKEPQPRLPAAGADGERPPLLAEYQDFSRSQVWEAYRSLRTSILLSHSGKPPQTILVTSALPGEGKTTTSLHTAMVLAQTGARTLLIDLDMRKPALARAMGFDGTSGMSNFLSGNSDLTSQLLETADPNLFVLAAGPHPPNPAELIGSDRMQLGLKVLKDYFKYIVIDSPPVMSVTDPLILATQADGVVLVVHGGKTPRDVVRKATDRLESVGARILGGMINNVDFRKSEYSYYYRYDYEYSDGAHAKSKGAA